MNEKDISTKQKYLMKALELFSQRGYEAVSLSQIAEAVGCTKTALYKHFKSKRDLFDALAEMSDRGFSERMEVFQVDFDKHPEKRQEYAQISVDELVGRTLRLFEHTVFDELPGQFRKLMTIEQFHMPEIAAKYNNRYVESQYSEYEALFRMLMEEGRMKSNDPKLLAVTFMSPVIIMVGVCDRQPDKRKEALSLLEKHVREFCRNYFQ